jgi:hypothetical protein
LKNVLVSLHLANEIPKFTLPGNNDMVVVVASLMKLWLRELTDGVIPAVHFNSFQKAQNDTDLQNILKSMQITNLRCLEYILRFLVKLSSYSEHNKMVETNIAIIFGPSVFRCPSEGNPDSQDVVTENFQSVELFQTLMKHFDALFPATSNEIGLEITNRYTNIYKLKLVTLMAMK